MSTPRRLALITGAARGLGLHTAAGLLQAGCDVVLSDRDHELGCASAARLQHAYPDAEVQFQPLDLGSLAQIEAFASRWLDTGRDLDILINNAGLYPPFRRAVTADAIELGIGVGFYGHFALTARLLPALLRSAAARVVCVSSIAHASGRFDPRDPRLEQDYDCNRAYSSCKLACLVFARELDRRAQAAGAPLRAAAAHPGIARTAIGQSPGNPARGPRDYLIRAAIRLALRYLGQDPAAGARPIVHAATVDELPVDAFFGPGGFGQFRGPPVPVRPRARALARCQASELWQQAEAVTATRFDWACA